MSKSKTSKKDPTFNENNLSDMMREVNAMLQKNPEMVKKVSKCVNSIFENESLMTKIVSEINTGIVVESDSDSDSDTESEPTKLNKVSVIDDCQILDKSESTEPDLASSNEHIQ